MSYYDQVLRDTVADAYDGHPDCSRQELEARLEEALRREAELGRQLSRARFMAAGWRRAARKRRRTGPR